MVDDRQSFRPTEIWTPREIDFELEPAIEAARTELNSKNPDQLIHELQRLVKHSDNGVTYAVLKGERSEEYSDTDALVMFNPFANTATANMLVRSEFIREVAKQANVRDEEGKLKPVIMLASPGLYGSKLKLTRKDKKLIRSGNLGPAAKEYLHAVSALGYGRVALLGASQGADLAIAGGQHNTAVNLDKTSLAAAEPAGVKTRTPLELALNFSKAGPDIDERAKASGLSALNAAHAIRKDYRAFWLSLTYPTNWRTLEFGMAHSSFESQLQSLITTGKLDRIVVGYGDASLITPDNSIEPSLARLHEKVNSSLLIDVKVKGGTHAWPEELPVLAKLYLKSLV